MRTEDRGQRTEDRGQRTEDRGTIHRITTSDCDRYLSELKGISYREYRKNWDCQDEMYMEKQRHPLQLNIQLTSYCNLRCKMCYFNFIDNKTHEHMSMSLVDQIVKEAKELHIESLWLGSFTECLLHPNIIEVMEKFAQVEPLDYWLATNGTLLNKKIAKKALELAVTWLTISLDAATPQTYRLIRGGDLDVVERNILEFLNIREKKNSRLPFLRVSFVDMKENHAELEAFKKKWENVADKIDIQTLVDYSEDAVNAPVDESFVCKDPFRLLSIKYNGELLPCCNCAYKDCGQQFYLQDMSIKEFWESPFHKELVESLRIKHYKPCCMDCVRRFRKM